MEGRPHTLISIQRHVSVAHRLLNLKWKDSICALEAAPEYVMLFGKFDRMEAIATPPGMLIKPPPPRCRTWLKEKHRSTWSDKK